MYKFKKALIGLIGLMSLMAIVTVVHPKAGTAAPTPSTQNVNVVNTPTVNAQQSGQWNVNINGTPMMRDADNPVRQPFHAFSEMVLPFGQRYGYQPLTTVPVGKLLVIEAVSVNAEFFGDEKVTVLALVIGGASYYLHPVEQPVDGSGRRLFVASQEVRMYVEAGNILQFYVERYPADGQPGIGCNVFGYYVDQP